MFLLFGCSCSSTAGNKYLLSISRFPSHVKSELFRRLYNKNPRQAGVFIFSFDSEYMSYMTYLPYQTYCMSGSAGAGSGAPGGGAAARSTSSGFSSSGSAVGVGTTGAVNP